MKPEHRRILELLVPKTRNISGLHSLTGWEISTLHSHLNRLIEKKQIRSSHIRGMPGLYYFIVRKGIKALAESDPPMKVTAKADPSDTLPQSGFRWLVICMAVNNQPLTMDKIHDVSRRKFGYHDTTARAQLYRMEAEGLIVKRRLLPDRKRLRVLLTEKGERIYDLIQTSWKEANPQEKA